MYALKANRIPVKADIPDILEIYKQKSNLENVQYVLFQSNKLINRTWTIDPTGKIEYVDHIKQQV